MADVLTPNQFEAEVLTGRSVGCVLCVGRQSWLAIPEALLYPIDGCQPAGIKIETESDAQRACLYLHAHGPGTVVVTSAALATEDGEGPKGDCLHVLGSTRASTSCLRLWQALTPRSDRR